MSDPERLVTCGLCGLGVPPSDAARGTRSSICRACVGAGLSQTLARAAEIGDGETVRGAFVACDLCGAKTPPASMYDPREDGRVACATCLADAYALLTRSLEVDARRRSYFPKSREDRLAATVLDEHFAGLSPSDVVTSSRTFPGYLRADLQRTLDRLLAEAGAHSYGLHASYNFQTMHYAALVDRSRDPVRIAPLSYEDLDIGEQEPVRCVRCALGLAREGDLPYATVLTPAHHHGRSLGWHVEICVPAGTAGIELTRRLFRAIEWGVQRSASYRGKVLSLEREPHYDGQAGGSVVVHRLAPVAREDIILPERTLALIERNVFRFFARRERLRALDMSMKKGLLFYGPPGTGKTHTIRYLAAALREHTTLLVTAEQVAHIAEYTALARLLSPSIVVLEDVDLIARDREDLETPGQESLLNRLLNEMDGLRDNAEVLFILTTNRPEALEAALAGRPGRVDQAIEFPLPDAACRRKLLELYRRGLVFDEPLAQLLVRRTEGASPAFLKELARRIALVALERGGALPTPTVADLDTAIGEMLFDGGRLNAALLGMRPPAADLPE